MAVTVWADTEAVWVVLDRAMVAMDVLAEVDGADVDGEVDGAGVDSVEVDGDGAVDGAEVDGVVEALVGGVDLVFGF